MATLEVQLKREQLKVQSLEKDLEQKVNARAHRGSHSYSGFLLSVVLNCFLKCCNISIFSSQAKEVKDVTELCDELLLKVQKHGF